MSTAQKLQYYFIGVAVLSFGVANIILSHLGIGAWEAFNVGLTRSTHMSLTSAYMVSGFGLLLAAYLLTRRVPSILAFVTTTVIGATVNLWILAIPALVPKNILMIGGGWVSFLLGLVVTSSGVAVYLQAGAGRSPVDEFMMALHQRFSLSIGLSKTIDNLIGLFFASLLGGAIGWGTIIFTFLLGPLINPQYKLLRRNLNRGTHCGTDNG